MNLDDFLQPALTERELADRYRTLLCADSPQQVERTVGDAKLVSFCSNDYLGLANHPSVIEAFQKAAKIYGLGSGASHLVSGHSRPHHELEEALARFTGRREPYSFRPAIWPIWVLLTHCLVATTPYFKTS